MAHALRFDGTNRLLHLHSEVEQRPQKRMWVLRDLFGANPHKPLLEQTNTNWVAYETFLPAGGNYFLVTGGPRDTNQVRSSVVAVDVESGRQIWDLPSAVRYYHWGLILDPREKFLAYPPDGSDPKMRWLYRLPGSEFIRKVYEAEAISPTGTGTRF